MQLTGTLLTDASAHFGNDIATFPDFPAEIRAPQGTVGGVSGFQVHLGHIKIFTPGDKADLLVAMNPAALKANEKNVKSGGTIIVDIDAFTDRNLKKAGYKTNNPFEESNLSDCHILKPPISTLTREALKDLDLDNKSILRSKNMFVLGMVDFMFSRPLEATIDFFKSKFAKKPILVEANSKALNAGFAYAENSHAIYSYRIAPSKIEKGRYRNIKGNEATAWGLVAASEKSGLPLFCGSYPITPATDILQYLSELRFLDVKTFQAEDEIAGISTAIGASFAGHLAVTTTSGPGLALKTEASGLAVIAELPLVIVNVQRGGPSTGLPTKTEQSDLLQALFGRSGESPLPVIAATSPADSFYSAFEAARIALEHMTPIILLTDGYIANGSQPFLIPKMSDLPEIKPPIVAEGTENYQPYERLYKENTVRGWAIPGKKNLQHRLGGLEKMAITGTVSYVPENHEQMTKEREDKIKHIVEYIPLQEVEGDQEGDVLLVGWGGTYGHLKSTFNELTEEGRKISFTHFKYINPLPKNTGEILGRFKKIIVCEINMGEFAKYLRMNFNNLNIYQINKMQGLPFRVDEIKEKTIKIMEG
ncbi:MAG TPA: 2-oxoacid:acceptor oxidoreductase subunit alpha [Bacteroidales bacterium]|nr:2-oxoacid:acceptor oxidoreductase subunit alpha [Bacteroidales bacterium]